MGYYNGKKVLSVVRAGFKGGSLTLNAHGRYIPQNYGYEGFTEVVNQAPETPTNVKKYIEGDNSIKYLAFGTDITKITGNFQCFPNLETIVILNTSQVLNIASNAWDGTKVVTDGVIIVPNTLLSAYQTAYPNWTFSSWEYQTVFTIPFIGETTLTADYVQAVVNMTGGSISVVNKIIIPSDFTEYERGSLTPLFNLLGNYVDLETWNVSLFEVANALPSASNVGVIGELYIHTDKWNFYNTDINFKCKKLTWKLINGTDYLDTLGSMSNLVISEEMTIIDGNKCPQSAYGRFPNGFARKTIPSLRFYNSINAMIGMLQTGGNIGTSLHSGLIHLYSDELSKSIRISESYQDGQHNPYARANNVVVEDWLALLNTATDYSQSGETYTLDVGSVVIDKINNATGGSQAIANFVAKGWTLL